MYVGTPHFITDEKQALWRFSDSGMHQACFKSWPYAEEYRRLFNQWSAGMTRHPRQMLADGMIVAKNLNGSLGSFIGGQSRAR